MFCKCCGSEIADGVEVCPVCGDEVDSEIVNAVKEVSVEVVEVQSQQTSEDAAMQASQGKQILAFSIVGLALPFVGFIPVIGGFVGFPGYIAALIFSIIARSKIKAYKKKFGALRGPAAVGNGLSIPGLILSILGLACFALGVGLWLLYFVLGVGGTFLGAFLEFFAFFLI